MIPTEQGPVLSRAPYAILAVAGIVIATVFAAVAALASKPATQASPGPVRPGPVATGGTTSATPRSAAPAPVVTSTEIVMSTTTGKPTTTTSRATPTTTTTVNQPAPQPPAPQPPAPPPPPKAPEARFTFGCQGGGQACSFDGTGSFDPDGKVIYYAWAFGDGKGVDGPDRSRVAHTYDAPGTYTVTMAIMDNSGMTDTVERQVRVGG